ncbi:uncharacterized protein TNCT_730091 [Trichonephila clavata]|uniref:Uncharacterized protein n=1 Tax=Trichonephila clavata TaxID=2740835 RepID=A0A8X6F2F7_TRICU|nr:uncharacterized protein TNCT_730091 [Trichonephila clavata]
MARHKYSTSYGIVVKTVCQKIVIINRKVPYCIQSFYISLHKQKYEQPSAMFQFKDVQELFEDTWLPYMKEHDLVDYKKYLDTKCFEDYFDFPHGQLRKKKNGLSLTKIFYDAYMEFKEETGFFFYVRQSDIKNFPVVTVEYKGLDDFTYQQHYFIVNNVRILTKINNLKPFIPWNDDSLIYRGLIIPIELAYEQFVFQQNMKKDMKHILCSNYFENLYYITALSLNNNSEESENKDSDL